MKGQRGKIDRVPVTVYLIGTAMKKSLTFASKASARHRRRADLLAHLGRAPL
jgi:hypothetical protein